MKKKYYSLGSATLKVNDWNIKGFAINSINVTFRIYIIDQILKKEIANLQICLNNLLDVMSKSSITKRNDKGRISTSYGVYVLPDGNNQNYTVDIAAAESKEIYEKIKLKYSDKAFFDDILNLLYEELTMVNSQSNFESLKGVSCKFSTKIANNKKFVFRSYERNSKWDSVERKWVKELEYNSLIREVIPNQTFDIHLVFNSVFKIKLNDDFLVEKRNAKKLEKVIGTWTYRITDELIGDGHRIIFN